MIGRTLSIRTMVIIGVGLFLMLTLYTWLPLLRADSTAALAVANLETIVPVGIAAGVGLWAAFEFPRGTSLRLTWLFMGLAVTMYEAASILFAYYEVVLHVEPQSPGWADLFYAASYPLAVVALVIAIRSVSGGANPAPVMATSFAVVLGLSVVLWAFVLRPVVATPSDLVNAAYAIADLVVLLPLGITLVYVTNRMGAARAALPWWTVIAGFALVLAADTLYTVLAATGTYLTGGLADIGFSLGYFLLGVAASVAVDVARLEAAGK